MKKYPHHNSEEFHAGRFLREQMLGMGRDIEWLSSLSGYDVDFLTMLFEQPNMDAELFVRIGNALGPTFFDECHRLMFPDGCLTADSCQA